MKNTKCVTCLLLFTLSLLSLASSLPRSRHHRTEEQYFTPSPTSDTKSSSSVTSSKIKVMHLRGDGHIHCSQHDSQLLYCRYLAMKPRDSDSDRLTISHAKYFVRGHLLDYLRGPPVESYSSDTKPVLYGEDTAAVAWSDSDNPTRHPILSSAEQHS